MIARLRAQNALLHVQNLAKPIHVQLPYKGAKVGVFEEARQEFSSELFRIGHYSGEHKEKNNKEGMKRRGENCMSSLLYE